MFGAFTFLPRDSRTRAVAYFAIGGGGRKGRQERCIKLPSVLTSPYDVRSVLLHGSQSTRRSTPLLRLEEMPSVLDGFQSANAPLRTFFMGSKEVLQYPEDSASLGGSVIYWKARLVE